MRTESKRRTILRWTLAAVAGLAAGVLFVVLLSTASLSGTPLAIATVVSVGALFGSLFAVAVAMKRGQRFGAKG